MGLLVNKFFSLKIPSGCAEISAAQKYTIFEWTCSKKHLLCAAGIGYELPRMNIKNRRVLVLARFYGFGILLSHDFMPLARTENSNTPV
jgi:hypothetical protein